MTDYPKYLATEQPLLGRYVGDTLRNNQNKKQKLKKIIAQNCKEEAVAQNEDQIDLYYLKSILVSTGWNKNDDVFDSKELWAAKNTPEDKPFNFMHNEKRYPLDT